MATLDEVYPRKLSFGRVAERTVWVLGRQPIPIFALALVLAGLPGAYRLYRIGEMMNFADGPFSFLESKMFWGFGLVSMLISAFLEATIFAVAFGELGGRRPTPREIFAAGGKFFLPLFAVNFLAFWGIVLGLILLIVPGVMLALAWMVAGPALMVERSGITAVFGRSADLTRNNRWRLFGMVLIYCVASSIIQNNPGMAHFRGGGFDAIDLMMSPLNITIHAVLASALTAIALTTLAVIYVELRTVKEGAEPADLDQVFS